MNKVLAHSGRGSKASDEKKKEGNKRHNKVYVQIQKIEPHDELNINFRIKQGTARYGSIFFGCIRKAG